MRDRDELAEIARDTGLDDGQAAARLMTHARSPMGRVELGSVALQVVRTASRLVFLLHPGGCDDQQTQRGWWPDHHGDVNVAAQATVDTTPADEIRRRRLLRSSHTRIDPFGWVVTEPS